MARRSTGTKTKAKPKSNGSANRRKKTSSNGINKVSEDIREIKVDCHTEETAFMTHARRHEVTTLLFQGYSIYDIAEKMGVKRDTIDKDIQFIKRLWLENCIRDFESIKAEEIARINWIEAEAIRSWLKSLETNVTERTVEETEEKPEPRFKRGKKSSNNSNSAGRKKQIKERIARSTSGDVKFLEVIIKCRDQKMRIYGLGNPSSQISARDNRWDILTSISQDPVIDVLEEEIAKVLGGAEQTSKLEPKKVGHTKVED